MSMLMAMDAMQKYALRQREQEREALQHIANIVSVDYAETAAETLDHRKHNYSFEGYLELLNGLKDLLLAGLEPVAALDAVQTGWTVEIILSFWRCGNE